MALPKKRKQSKRLLCRTKYKVAKKVREHNRKKRREAKKNPKKKTKNSMIIAPNMCPFKEEIIEQLNEAKKKEREIRMANFAAMDQLPEEKKKKSEPSLPFRQRWLAKETREDRYPDKNYENIISMCDVVLEVLDIRDPLATRSKEIEDYFAIFSDKKRIILLNKIDLVPKSVVSSWVDYFSKIAPTVPFRASREVRNTPKTSAKDPNFLARIKKKQANKCFGETIVWNYLLNAINTPILGITIGVVGMPKVGKSCVVDTIKWKYTSGDEPVPSKKNQEVCVFPFNDAKIELLPWSCIGANTILDKPSDSRLLIKQALDVDLQNVVPIKLCALILPLINRNQLKLMYDMYVENTEDYTQILEVKARRNSLINKHGKPDHVNAAKSFMKDLKDGKLLYYTRPPNSDAKGLLMSLDQETKVNIDGMYARLNKELLHCRDKPRVIFFDMTDSC
ncbi:guanine nucleotide-binding protein-like 3 homolog [Daktulosphaira vitifoliae]|uniref:guanine nucleotide-binding protein-like 3 homolog n=1 Tax=Daktulosphaira vitifoliae TaxID=58002 RepID=UPI0021AA9D1F|nr:guanine nucleotide-binding protein-like 3 homolog [Daktulosphaira vitifoliae]